MTELELRIENWNSRLALKAAKVSMEDLVELYLQPSQTLRRALGVSRVLLQISYQRQDEEIAKVLEIVISDGNGCSLNSERDPVLRDFGRKALEGWRILRAFRDLEPSEAISLAPVMAELWELDQKTQKGDYFISRGIKTELLERASLIRKKEVEPLLVDEEDPESQGPTISERTVFTVDLDWVQERLVSSLKSFMKVVAPDDIARQAVFVGVLALDDRDVPCYLARGLGEMKRFYAVDEYLRARSKLGPGIVFTGAAVGPRLVGANVVIPLVFVSEERIETGIDRDAVAVSFRAGRSLALGAGTLDLVEDHDRSAARLHFPDREPLDLFGEPAVRAFRLLVGAAKRSGPGVASGDLIEGSGSAGFQQMIGGTRWPVVETYVEKNGPRRWKLKGY